MDTATVTVIKEEMELPQDFSPYDDDDSSNSIIDQDIDPLVDIKVELTEYDPLQHSSSDQWEDARKRKPGRKQNRDVKCEECGRICQGNWALKKHLQSHSTERPYKCSHPNCTKSFKTNCNYLYHEKMYHSNSRPFICSYPGCSKSYKLEGYLKNHLDSHKKKQLPRKKKQLPLSSALPTKGPASFKCTAEINCTASFTNPVSLKYHIFRKHQELPIVSPPPMPITRFTCNVCSIEFPLESQLNLHRGLHVNEKKFPCPQEGCTSAFKFKNTLYDHQRRKHPQERDPFKIPSCKTETETTEADPSTTSKVISPIPTCSKSFTNKNIALKTYERRKHPQERDPFKIPSCKTETEAIIKNLPVEKMYKLNIEVNEEPCIEKFKNTTIDPILETKLQINKNEEFSNLIITNVTTQGLEADPIAIIKTEADPSLPSSTVISPIPTCSKTFTSKSYALKTDGECKLCFKKLKSSEELITHVVKCRLYYKNRFRYCIPCNRKFGSAATLKKHSLKLHSSRAKVTSKESKYKCQLCSKEYTTNQNFRYHMESHKTEEKQTTFQCQLCDKSYIRKDSLDRHMQTHSNNKPFKCTFPNCSKAFKISTYLTNHLLTHSDARPFTCPEVNCGKSFKFRTNLRDHLGRQHLKN